MEVIPSIDLRDGKVVRLHQGDYAQETVYSADAVAQAKEFAAAGASLVHVVDLDGARTGSPTNASVYRRIGQESGIPWQLGGGLRDAETISAVVAMGASRVVLGTAAVDDPDLVKQVVSQHGAERIIVGVDARDGMVAVQGWTQHRTLSALDLMARMADFGVRRFVYTDISRDGTLTEPNFDAVAVMVERANALGAVLIASGGIRSIAHLERLAGLGAEAAIIGSAIYTGNIDLAQAVWALA